MISGDGGDNSDDCGNGDSKDSAKFGTLQATPINQRKWNTSGNPKKNRSEDGKE